MVNCSIYEHRCYPCKQEIYFTWSSEKIIILVLGLAYKRGKCDQAGMSGVTCLANPRDPGGLALSER